MLDISGQTVFYSTDFKLEFLSINHQRLKCGEIFRHSNGSFGFTCVYCGDDLDVDDHHGWMDHINTHYEVPAAKLTEYYDSDDQFPTYATSDATTNVDTFSDLTEVMTITDARISVHRPSAASTTIVPQTLTKTGRPRKQRQTPGLVCDYCHIVVPLKSLLHEHMLVVHNYGVGCTYCGRQFKSTNHMISHVKCVHNKERPYGCQHCDKSFSTVSSLISHTRGHINERPFLCSSCGKRFILKNQLNVHRLRVHVPKSDPRHRRYPCHVCDYKTPFQFRLAAHLKTHSTARNFRCDHCERMFKSAKSLRQHVLLHTGEKPYACRYCGVKFAQTAGKRGHERKHHEQIDIKQEEMLEEQYLEE